MRTIPQLIMCTVIQQQRGTESAAERVSSDSLDLVFLHVHVSGRPDHKLLTEESS